MKTSYFSLTFIIAFFPALLLTFNISIDHRSQSAETLLNTSSNHCSRNPSGFCNHYHDNALASPGAAKAIPFGAQLGSHIRQTAPIDQNYQVNTVVIDAGHGGKDSGCSGTNTQEKEIALSIALQLGKSLQQNFPNVKFIYTRDADVFIPLNRRAEIANNAKADLFLSIHCNYFPHSSRPRGSETYVLGLHRAEDNLEVAKRENAAIYYEEDYKEAYDGYDPNSEEGHIILSMFQNAFLEQSISFANKIENNIQNFTQQRSRGVKQAGFLVLRKTTMPSVLVEAGYLSNGKDNAYLATADGQLQIVNAIAKAFADYKTEVESGSSPVYAQQSVQVAATPTQGMTAKGVPPQRQKKSVPKIQPAPEQQPIVTKAPASAPQQKPSTKSKVLKHSLIVPNPDHSSATTKPAVARSDRNSTQSSSEKVDYKVVLAASQKLISTDDAPWKNLPYDLQITKEGTTFRYLAIGFADFEAAVAAKKQLRSKGFPEAFLAAYQNGKRIDMAKAKAITGIR